MYKAAVLALAGLASAAPPADTSKLNERQGSYTMLRFGCPQLDIDRLDPLVDPGMVPSGHIHQIVGGNAFNATMTTGDVSTKATCTTCSFSDDFSNYWTGNLYFHHKNGSYKRVPQAGAALQFGDRYSNQMGNGILVYYVSYQPGKITVPKPGFRMLVGDPLKRTADPRMKYANCFRCYSGPNYGGDVAAPCQGNNDTPYFPQAKNCYGVRSNILYPTCWDGVNLDSPNHKDHVAFPSTGNPTFLNQANPACPATHPVKIPQIMLEVVWNTTQFNDASMYSDINSRFVFSFGDTTGYGQHADYVFGWKGDALKIGMDASGCMGASCKNMATQSVDKGKACAVKQMAVENVEGWISSLPGQDSASDGSMPMYKYKA